MHWVHILALSLFWAKLAAAASRTTLTTGALVVRSSEATSGEYSTLTAAIASLGSSSTAASIFLYAGAPHFFH